ncbi:Low-density lipoprotein receptor-related protein 4 [Amphibalanus amphitrite]|uniref:Low-density lipoprotein receptor-related protein 4 n=1 Tax=Amphibalanus amphitrite TaxID=1232801 RepID=A0A6A4WKF3_AMPAM|nr:Low-density lipoprotein receptor-related protein 4 [Amphibalanus amphitrite]
MALDPIGRHVYWLNRPAIYGRYTDVNRATYDGKSTAQVKRVNDAEHITDIDALDNRVALVRKNRTIISILDATTGEMTDLFSGDVKQRTPNPALVEPEDLLAVKLVPATPIPEAENGCSGATGSCKDFCIPTVTDGTPAATCLCPEGLQLVELACREEQPSLALLVGADRLQAADLRTERVSTILTNLTAGRRVDVYRPPDGHQLLLFWLDAGSLFGGRWSPGGSVTDVQLLEPATDTETVEEVAVYTSQRQLYWIKKAQSEDGSGSSMVVQMSPLDHSYTKTSIKFIYTFTFGFLLLGKGDPTPHVSHPSLADAGGLDTTDSRLFWTERTTGRLWSADKKTGGDVRAVADTTAGRSLRLVQPWLRPTIAPVCEDGAAGCSHFCRRYIPGYTSEPVDAKCDCPDGMHLRDDQKTCEDGGDASGSADEFPECVSLSAK